MLESVSSRRPGVVLCPAIWLLVLTLCGCGSDKRGVIEAYDDYRAAIEASDLERLAGCVARDRRAELDDPDAAVKVGLIAAMSPDEFTITSVETDGDSSEIRLEAEMEGQPMEGTIRLVREGGAWKVDHEDWSVEMSLGGTGSGDWAARLKENLALMPEARLTWAAHQGTVTRTAFTGDGMYVVSIGYDDYAVRIWDRENGALVGEAASPSRPTDMVVHPRTQEIIVANVDGDVLVYPFSMLSGLGEPREWADAAGPSGRLALSSDGKTLATSSFNSPARLWNFPDGGSRKNLSDSESLRGLAFSPKGNLLAAGTMGNAFVVWDLEANGPFGRREVKIPSVGEKSDVWSVAVSPDGRKLLTGHMDSSITLWDLKSRKQIHNTYVRDASTFSVAFSPDGTLFASAQANGKVYLWDTESVQRLRGLEAHTGAATTVAFSPAEWEILASGGEDGRIVIWE